MTRVRVRSVRGRRLFWVWECRACFAFGYSWTLPGAAADAARRHLRLWHEPVPAVRAA